MLSRIAMVVMVVLTLATVAFAESYKAQKYERVGKISASVHIVKKGDWVSKLAQSQYGDPKLYGNIVAVNNLARPDCIFPGDTLYVPMEPVVADTLVLPDGHVVVTGIGKKNDMGGTRKGSKAGTEIGTETEADSTQSGKVFCIQGKQNQIFEGCTFNQCTFNFETPVNETKPDSAKNDSVTTVVEFDPDGWYLGLIGGSNFDGIQEGYAYLAYRNGPFGVYAGASPIMKRSPEFGNQQTLPLIVGGSLFPVNWCAMGVRSSWRVLTERSQFTEWWICGSARLQKQKPIRGFVPYTQVEFGRNLINYDESTGRQNETNWEPRIFVGVEYGFGKGGRK